MQSAPVENFVLPEKKQCQTLQKMKERNIHMVSHFTKATQLQLLALNLDGHRQNPSRNIKHNDCKKTNKTA